VFGHTLKFLAKLRMSSCHLSATQLVSSSPCLERLW